MSEKKDGLGYGVNIHRRFDVAQWREQLALVPEEHRAEAERYLRDIAARLRVVRALKQKKGRR